MGPFFWRCDVNLTLYKSNLYYIYCLKSIVCEAVWKSTWHMQSVHFKLILTHSSHTREQRACYSVPPVYVRMFHILQWSVHIQSHRTEDKQCTTPSIPQHKSNTNEKLENPNFECHVCPTCAVDTAHVAQKTVDISDNRGGSLSLNGLNVRGTWVQRDWSSFVRNGGRFHTAMTTLWIHHLHRNS